MGPDRDALPSGTKLNSSAGHWAELKSLLDSALALTASEREHFLKERCGNDRALRDEINSLLLAYEQSDDFLAHPLESLDLPNLDLPDTEASPGQPEELPADRRIGAYHIERQIGRGGMGAVYLATRADGEFNKRVAIKLIRHGREDEFSIRRFRHERQILARLESPFVARLIDGGTAETGLPYFVMEYVEGQPITEYCDNHSLHTRARVELFLKVCSGVQYAHERNIIHRDLKPGNILVKESGVPKLLDFGIAKIMGMDAAETASDATLAGFRILTPAYASPEQIRGELATVRSDVYSLGVILYELLCGERPSLNVIQPNSAAAAGRPREAHLSPHLRAVVLNAIRWDPGERYPTVEAFAADLKRYLEGFPPEATSRADFSSETVSTEISVAILPLRVLQADDRTAGFLASGITEVLVTRLSRIERFLVRPMSAVLKFADRGDAARIAKELRVKYILEGSLYKSGECVRVSVQLVYTEAGITVWSGQFDEQPGDLLKLEDSIAEQLASALIPHLTGEERERISRSGTSSGRAHEAYLRGRWHWNRSLGNQEELAKSLVCFTQAVTADPNYARAHAGLADYYLRLGIWSGLPPLESFAAAMQSARTAIQLDPSLSEAHTSLGVAYWAYARDYAAAEKHFNLAIIRNPEYAGAHYWFGLLNSACNRQELAIASLERARKIDPNLPSIAAALGFVHYHARQFDRAIELLLDTSRDLRVPSAAIDDVLVWCYLQAGNPEKAREAARRAHELSDGSSAAASALAQAERACGNQTAAVSLRNRLDGAARQKYVSGYDRASACLAVDDIPGALNCLEQAYINGDWWISWIAVDPRWDRLRGQPLFAKLIAKTQPAKAIAAEKASRKPVWLRAAPIAAALILLVVMLLAFPHVRSRRVPFQDLKFTRLTSNGIASQAVISPDGKHVAYTAMKDGATALFLRDLQASRTVELLPRIEGIVADLNFTEGGQKISFVNYAAKQPLDRRVLTLALSGGTPVPLSGSFSGPVSLSPDGKYAAFLQSNKAADRDELWMTDVASGRRRLLASLAYPQRFSWDCTPSWSPDAKEVAVAAEDRDSKGFLLKLYVISSTRNTRLLIPSPRWQWVGDIAWTGSKSALLVVGQQQDSSFQQIWHVPYPKGEARAIDSDLDDYTGASVTAGDSAIVSVQRRALSNIYVTKPFSPNAATRQLTQGSGRYFDLAWMPGGRLLYASDATGSADIWVMNADGSGARQIVSGAGRNYAPASSPDGKTIAFHSNRTSNWHVWSVNADGSEQQQLSRGQRDGNWPQFTPDGRSVVFHQSEPKGLFTLWKVPRSGGPSVQLTKSFTMHPAVSAKTGQIAAWFSPTLDNPRWKLAVFAPEGGEPLRIFDSTPSALPDTTLRWTPAGDAITFLDFKNGVANLWVQPLDGRKARPLTEFTSGDIYSFDWSQNGELVYSRGMTTADVVLIQDAKAEDQS